jgi:hypothetical protein
MVERWVVLCAAHLASLKGFDYRPNEPECSRHVMNFQ